jgi:hypothetical protein
MLTENEIISAENKANKVLSDEEITQLTMDFIHLEDVSKHELANIKSTLFLILRKISGNKNFSTSEAKAFRFLAFIRSIENHDEGNVSEDEGDSVSEIDNVKEENEIAYVVRKMQRDRIKSQVSDWMEEDAFSDFEVRASANSSEYETRASATSHFVGKNKYRIAAVVVAFLFVSGAIFYLFQLNEKDTFIVDNSKQNDSLEINKINELDYQRNKILVDSYERVNILNKIEFVERKFTKPLDVYPNDQTFCFAAGSEIQEMELVFNLYEVGVYHEIDSVRYYSYSKNKFIMYTSILSDTLGRVVRINETDEVENNDSDLNGDYLILEKKYYLLKMDKSKSPLIPVSREVQLKIEHVAN